MADESENPGISETTSSVEPVQQAAVTPLTPPAAPPPNAEQTLISEYEFDDVPEAESVDESPATGEVAGEPPPAAVTSPAAAATQLPKHGKRLIREALDLGLSDDQIRSMDTETLDETVYVLRKQAIAQFRDNSIQRAVQPDRNPPEKTAPPDPRSGISSPSSGDDLGMSAEEEAEFDPRLMGLLKRLHRENRELKQVVQTINGREQQREQETNRQLCDRKFQERQEVFGKGLGRELTGDSPEYLRRVAVLTLVDRDNSQASLETKIDRAIEKLYGKQLRNSAVEEPALTAQQEQWRNGGLARPTQRAGAPEPAGPKKAEKAVAAKMREMNGQVSDGIADPDNDFL